MIGCESTLAGRCVGLPPVNIIMAALLWGAALVLFDRVRLEVRDE